MNKAVFNPTKHLIIINNEIKNDISSFQFDGNKINIKFENNSKVYSYRSSNIEILDNPKNLELDKSLFFNGDVLLFDIEKVLEFGKGYYKVFLNTGLIISNNKIKIKENLIKKEGIKDILEYLRTILDSKNNDEITQYLKSEFDKLDCILPSSVLSDFLLKKNKKGSRFFDSKKLIYPFNFNLSQKKALENAFKSNISVIEGPPGTGKTQTILNIIANIAIMQDKTVAVVSNNNSAVSNVKEKLEKEGYGFFLSMLGNKGNKENFFNNIPDIREFDFESLDDCSLNLEEISDLMDINNKKHKSNTELSDYMLEQKHFENYFKKQEIKEIFRLPLWTKNSDKLMEFLAENSKRTKGNKNKGLLFKIKLFIKYGFTEFKKLDTSEIDLILSYQKKFYELKTKELSDIIKNFDNILNKNSYDDLVSEYIKFSKIQFERKLKSKFKNGNDFKFIKSNYFKEFSKFKDRFPVILSSTYAIVNSVPKGFMFDYLIIDESSQVDLITGLLVFSCCKNVIIVGDTKQLPHITNGKNPDDFNLDSCFDYYKHSILSSVLESYKENIPVTLLKEHYRCHPKIINFCNQKYYNGELIIYTKENENDNPLTIYRSAEGNHMRDIKNGESNGKYNQRELDIIEGILEGEEDFKDFENIGIITPFRKQVQKADAVFKKVVEVDTVHKFQGREKDTIIISTVLDNTKSGNIAIKFADQPSLINVAVSRAKNKLLIVTDNELFFKKGKEIKDLVKYVEYSSLDANIIESEIVGVFDLLYKNYSDKITLSNENIIQISKFKSEDIGNALIKKILEDDKFSNLSFRREVYLKNIISDTKKLNDIEKKFVNTTSRVDFLVYSNFGKTPLLVIEVDGVAFHENNPDQIERDQKKNSILDKYNIPYLRLKTNGSGEDRRVYDKLLSIVDHE